MMKRYLTFLLPLALLPTAGAGQRFFDDFDGEDLGGHWSEGNPKGAMNYSVHDSLLEILSFTDCQGCSNRQWFSARIAPYDDFDMLAVVGWEDAPRFQALEVSLGFDNRDTPVAAMTYVRAAGGDPANQVRARFRDGPSMTIEAPASGFHTFRLSRSNGQFTAYFDGNVILTGGGSAMQPATITLFFTGDRLPNTVDLFVDSVSVVPEPASVLTLAVAAMLITLRGRGRLR